MIYKILLSEFVEKQISKGRIPEHIIKSLLAWMGSIEVIGLEETRKVRGYHDEPLKGSLQGLRSIRLTKSWRAYYQIATDRIQFVKVERIDKHEY